MKKTSQEQQDIKDLEAAVVAAHKQTHIKFDELEEAKRVHKETLKALVGAKIRKAKSEGHEEPCASFRSLQANGQEIPEID